MSSVLRLPALLVVALIRGYQRTLAKALPPRCRFHPTCSEYAAQAITSNGLIRGGLAAIWRLARCAPWSKGGLDPVKKRQTGVEPARG